MDYSPRPRLGVAATAIALAAVLLPGVGVVPAFAEPLPVPALQSADADPWLDGMMAGLLKREGIPGAVVSIVADGRTVSSKGYGVADASLPASGSNLVDPQNTVFRVASVSKVFNATLVMQLVEEGKLDLDVDVQRYLDFELPRRFSQPITLRNLLSHTAGFEEHLQGLTETDPGKRLSVREFLADHPPAQIYAPGTVPAYSNYGNTLAGYIAQRILAQPYEEAFRQRVSDPLGMDATSYQQPLPAELQARAAQGHDAAGAKTDYEYISDVPAGALSTTAADMAKFMNFQLGTPPSPGSPASPVLSPATLATMQQPAIGESILGGLAAGARMALGFAQELRNGLTALSHTGDTAGFHSGLYLVPEKKAGIFIALNGDGKNLDGPHAIRTELWNAFADRYFPGPASAAPGTDPETAKQHAAAMAGKYDLSRTIASSFPAIFSMTGQVGITANPDGTISLEVPGPIGSDEYREISPWLWQAKTSQARLAVRTDAGKVSAISFDAANTLVPISPEKNNAFVLPALQAGTLVFAGAIVFRSFLWFRQRRERQPRARSDRIIGIASTVAAVSGLLAILAWNVFFPIAANFPPITRAVQVLTLFGALGVIPAGWQLVRSWLPAAGQPIPRGPRPGWRIAGHALLLSASLFLAWFGFVFHVFQWDISY
ncbi:MAG: beta-lactamase family protein [Renibacterium salmoninarum]|nr:beta-lactamase family protein [Renibacterium salmoninarum]